MHLETTTIYVKVAQPTDPLTIQSPLDRMNSANTPRPTELPRAESLKSEPTFHLSFHFQAAPVDKQVEKEVDATKVTLGIRPLNFPATTPLYLTRILAIQIRDGWFNLQIPPLERWEPVTSMLGQSERAKIESTRFFELPQSENPKRLSQHFS